jgi:phosphatidylglycerol lysyltransferase
MAQGEAISLTRELVMKYGWNATAYQLVNPGIDVWFSPEKDAAIGYVTRNRVRVVAGAPVCDNSRLGAVIERWESEARRAGESVCYFGAAGRVKKLLDSRLGYSTVVLGAQPVWDPGEWAAIVHGTPSLRAQLNRARNKGVAVREWPADEANGHPELRRTLTEWLQTRGLPPLHFLVEPETLSLLEGRRVFVAERQGRVLGFLVASPIPMRHGWLTEQFVRGFGAPNGTVELMVDFAMMRFAHEGAEYVTMGLVPLSRHAARDGGRNPLWLRTIMRWVRAHGRRFYNFTGLEEFKSKFRPTQWEPIYAIYNGSPFPFRALYAITAAFTKTSPGVALVKGLGRAVRQELRWIAARIRSLWATYGRRR